VRLARLAPSRASGHSSLPRSTAREETGSCSASRTDACSRCVCRCSEERLSQRLLPADARHASRPDLPKGRRAGSTRVQVGRATAALGYVAWAVRRGSSLAEPERSDRAFFHRLRRRSRRQRGSPDCVVDGEVCAASTARGGPSFSAMQQGKAGHAARLRRLRRSRDRRNAGARPARSAERPRPPGKSSSTAAPDDRADLGSLRRRRGASTRRRSERGGSRGVMAKRTESRLPSKASASRDWLKIKNARPRGVRPSAAGTKGQGKRESQFGALVLGTYRGG